MGWAVASLSVSDVKDATDYRDHNTKELSASAA